jgi:hypothetical protein
VGEAEEGPYQREEKDKEERWFSANWRREQRSSEAANSRRRDGSGREGGV